MYKLKEEKPTWKVFYVVFHKFQFSAKNCLIYNLMTFVMYQAFWNLPYLQTIQILFTVMTAQLHYVTLLILDHKN